jgi:hypothetical protein
MTLTPEQLKRIHTRADRQKYKDSDGETGKLSLFIRIGMSTLYDWHPAARAILKEIAFMTVKGEGDLMKPSAECRKDIPYDGWCWASEKTLALRVGCDDRTIRRTIARLKKDTIIHVRTWRDKFGRPHNEYEILEAVVDAARRDPEQPRPKCERNVRDANDGTFSSQHQPKRKAKAIGHLARKPQDISPVTHRTSRPSPIGQVAREPQDMRAVEGVDLVVNLVVNEDVGRVRTLASQGITKPFPMKQETAKPKPQPVTRPEPLPLTPEETCAECDTRWGL